MKIVKPELPPETKNHYFTIEPIFDHYKEIKVKQYCEECNHYTGFYLKKHGVKIIGYTVNKHIKDIAYVHNKIMESYILPKAVDMIFGGSIAVSKSKKKVKNDKNRSNV